ncbi:MAG TPA: UDP-N-acetylglucosamine 2-epimerase (non-hydrolyzing), partial [Candidatus Nitrosotalea sp.]|nr:UDP-N-acetylglucosamine 2-epimerase (non-hydrolyzing) [Candidatus Nitrosotalea sp.]
MTKISIVMGTRPEIIKLSPIIRLVKKRNTDVIFSGQHYDYDMGLRFIHELKLPKPDFTMKLTKNNPAKQLGQMIQELSDRFLETKPDTVIVQGDTNTVLAGAFAALKNNIPVSHVEAGLRSFDWRMPEEHNRIATDHVSEILFASTKVSRKNLLNEHVHGKIFVVGNTAIDAIEYNLGIAEKNSLIDVDGKFALLTLHRAENVDEKNTLSSIMSGVIKSGQKFVFPVHPRTKKRLYEFGLYDKIRESKNVMMIDSVGYFDILLLMKRCDFIVTDSGGIQEEATSRKIRKKVLVTRTRTDRPEAVESGFSEVVGVGSAKIQKSIEKTTNLQWNLKGTSPYGNGRTAEQILKIIDKYF